MSMYELYHYGVKGMRWGVRRDARILANHYRNKDVKRLKSDYKFGKIDKRKYTEGKLEANAKKNQYLQRIKNRFENAKSYDERQKIERDIQNTAIKDVPNLTIKRGAAVVNQVFGTVSIGRTALATAALSMINPAFAGAYMGAAAVTTAAEAGLLYMNRSILDKTS